MRHAIVITVCVALFATVASAGTAWGPRAGFTMDPDQFHVGGHVDAGAIAENVRFLPSVEVGFGDDITLVAFNGEAVYGFEKNWGAWKPYAGGGIGLNWYSWDAPVEGVDDSEMEIGLNILGGVQKPLSNGNSLFGEVKLGIADSPDLKLTVGYTFR